ncbi:hypothetical protein KJ611_01560 [Patescibacteria group bacterium]|nr:hypothetical protein [Patescibacteria group bacterium]
MHEQTRCRTDLRVEVVIQNGIGGFDRHLQDAVFRQLDRFLLTLGQLVRELGSMFGVDLEVSEVRLARLMKDEGHHIIFIREHAQHLKHPVMPLQAFGHDELGIFLRLFRHGKTSCTVCGLLSKLGLNPFESTAQYIKKSAICQGFLTQTANKSIFINDIWVFLCPNTLTKPHFFANLCGSETNHKEETHVF